MIYVILPLAIETMSGSPACPRRCRREMVGTVKFEYRIQGMYMSSTDFIEAVVMVRSQDASASAAAHFFPFLSHHPWRPQEVLAPTLVTLPSSLIHHLLRVSSPEAEATPTIMAATIPTRISQRVLNRCEMPPAVDHWCV